MIMCVVLYAYVIYLFFFTIQAMIIHVEKKHFELKKLNTLKVFLISGVWYEDKGRENDESYVIIKDDKGEGGGGVVNYDEYIEEISDS